MFHCCTIIGTLEYIVNTVVNENNSLCITFYLITIIKTWYNHNWSNFQDKFIWRVIVTNTNWKSCTFNSFFVTKQNNPSLSEEGEMSLLTLRYRFKSPQMARFHQIRKYLLSVLFIWHVQSTRVYLNLYLSALLTTFIRFSMAVAYLKTTFENGGGRARDESKRRAHAQKISGWEEKVSGSSSCSKAGAQSAGIRLSSAVSKQNQDYCPPAEERI